ncbi:DNA polymerase [Devosia naphthalenivorans]|uniref:DNA polymerase n=1 Tax=Devosia naphthalenivorans TaxID=2082392 RepID=UPI0013B05BC5|nr:DNA polymerase [Devosia naphthalenivorans]
MLDVTIPVGKVEPRAQKTSKRRKSTDPTRYLLVGFDTEYQSIAPVSQDKIDDCEAHNEVLSYQFWVKKLHADPDTPAQESNGVIIPNGDGDRISMAEFFVAAIGTFASEHPSELLPSDVILVGHFTRADLPAFSDFRENAKEFFSNVRNTFVSLNAEQRIEIADNETGEMAEFAVKLRDTLLLAPANAKSLADIGEIVGLPKLVLAESKEEEQRIKENMSAFRRDHWETFKAYAIRDAEVCVRYAEKVIRQYQALFGAFSMPLTLSEFGARKVLQDWEGRGWKPSAILGREAVRERKWNNKFKRYVTRKKHVYQETAYFEVNFVSETYHGGRNEQFAFGICEEGKWRDHDLSSAYPTAMSLIGQPDWSSVEHLTSLDEVSYDDLAYASVDFEFPEHLRFPTLPVRTEGGIIFPRRGRSNVAAPELWLARKLGAKLILRRGVKVSCNRQTRVFQPFIKECIQQRSQHKKGSFENLFWKEVGNSTYGKTAQGLREKRVYDLREDDMVALPESKLTQPFFASYITSFVRSVLGEILNGFSPAVQVFSVTTDGFLSNASDEEVETATRGELFGVFATARLELDPGSQPLEIKHEIGQPIGWRTRGSATLKLGSGEPVLQKGGIKTNNLFDTEQNNSYIVELFLNRQPGQTINYAIGLGLKAVFNADADFVFRSTTKLLSMEFDWKRMPAIVQERRADFEGANVSHLSFDTVPLTDIGEFKSLREAWERYNGSSRKVLKTLADFNNFWRYWKFGKLPVQVSRYMPRHNGALKRLRRDLTRAFSRHAAGFDIIRERMPQLKNAQFAQALADCGIACSVSDVENGKRREFVPFQTIRT